MNREIKCTILGDSDIGKTCMVASYTANTFPQVYTPTILDNYNALVNAGSEVVTLSIYDTSGRRDQEHADFRRPIIKASDIIIVCYSMISLPSLLNVRAYWYPEIQENNVNHVPVILVGTQKDQINHYSIEARNNRQEPAPDNRAQHLCAEVGFYSWLPCSALTQEGLKQVFDEAIKVCLKKNSPMVRKKKKTNKKCCGL
ncbi:unnamed protein product [Blepharisma stoltei]|uniref:Uncharacterized protein n=1 Tax=Blepharisma stoltei TaxID=1481888 RepID=A0AAU9IZB6_9CILI|nr:unnamed protein product [Blepharisma stoltei]